MRHRRLSWVLLSCAWVVGCTVVLPDGLGNVSCDDEGAVGPPACEAGQVCGAGTCTDCDVREACGDGVDNDCDGHVDQGCPGTGGGGGSAGGGGDSAACCSAGDCAAGKVCDADGKCVPAPDLGLATLGAGLPGAACSAQAQCRSGRCEAGACADRCCSDRDCDTGRCAWNPGVGWACGPGGRLSDRSTCSADGDCGSGLCIDAGPAGLCFAGCCSSQECGVFDYGTGPVAFRCGYHDRPGAPLIRACDVGGGGAAAGALCGQDGDCRSVRCVKDATGASRCTDACCRDTDCPAELPSCGWVDEAGARVLRCVPG